MIEFACVCGNRVTMSPKFAGRAARCVKCGQQFVVPRPDEAFRITQPQEQPGIPARSESLPSSAADGAQRSQRRVWSTIAWATTVTLVVLGSGAAVFLATGSWDRTPSPPSPPKTREFGGEVSARKTAPTPPQNATPAIAVSAPKTPNEPSREATRAPAVSASPSPRGQTNPPASARSASERVEQDTVAFLSEMVDARAERQAKWIVHGELPPPLKYLSAPYIEEQERIDRAIRKAKTDHKQIDRHLLGYIEFHRRAINESIEASLRQIGKNLGQLGDFVSDPGKKSSEERLIDAAVQDVKFVGNLRDIRERDKRAAEVVTGHLKSQFPSSSRQMTDLFWNYYGSDINPDLNQRTRRYLRDNFPRKLKELPEEIELNTTLQGVLSKDFATDHFLFRSDAPFAIEVIVSPLERNWEIAVRPRAESRGGLYLLRIRDNGVEKRVGEFPAGEYVFTVSISRLERRQNYTIAVSTATTSSQTQPASLSRFMDQVPFVGVMNDGATTRQVRVVRDIARTRANSVGTFGCVFTASGLDEMFLVGRKYKDQFWLVDSKGTQLQLVPDGTGLKATLSVPLLKSPWVFSLRPGPVSSLPPQKTTTPGRKRPSNRK